MIYTQISKNGDCFTLEAENEHEARSLDKISNHNPRISLKTNGKFDSKKTNRSLIHKITFN